MKGRAHIGVGQLTIEVGRLVIDDGQVPDSFFRKLIVDGRSGVELGRVVIASIG
jgi:hypothetical protein